MIFQELQADLEALCSIQGDCMAPGVLMCDLLVLTITDYTHPVAFWSSWLLSCFYSGLPQAPTDVGSEEKKISQVKTDYFRPVFLSE